MSAVLSTPRTSALNILGTLVKYRQILSASVRVELAKRYSGSALGKLWIVLYPLLLLSIYLFVYMAVFKVQFAGSSRLDYVIFVFAGLIPYIGFMEAVTGGCVSLKQNMHLIKNVMLPIELIPARSVLIAMAGQLVGLVMLIVLITANGGLGMQLLAVPFMFVLQLIMLGGIVLILAPLAVLIPDLAHFVNLAVMLLIFISPIGFQPSMVPSGFQFVVYGNPVFYMIDAFRWGLIKGHPFSGGTLVAYTAFSLGVFVFGSLFFSRLRAILVDAE